MSALGDDFENVEFAVLEPGIGNFHTNILAVPFAKEKRAGPAVKGADFKKVLIRVG